MLPTAWLKVMRGTELQTNPLKCWEEFEAAMTAFLVKLETLGTEKYPVHVSKPVFGGTSTLILERFEKSPGAWTVKRW